MNYLILYIFFFQISTGFGHGEGNWSGQVPGMLGIDAERPEDCLRRGDTCRPGPPYSSQA